METYSKLLEALIQANQACPRICGKIFKSNKGSTKGIEVIPGKRAKYGVILRCAILQFVGSLVLFRVGSILVNKTNGKFSASQLVDLNICLISFSSFMSMSERYRLHGLFPHDFALFANSLFQMGSQYINGTKIETSTLVKAVIYLCKYNYYFCVSIFPLSITFACMFEPTLPMNVLWFLSNGTIIITKVAYLVTTSILNLLVWILPCAAGYGCLTDLLCGTMGLEFCQKIITRRLLKIIKSNGTLESITDEFVAYRALQLVVEHFNKCVSSFIVLLLIACGVFHIGPAVLLVQQTQMDVHISLPLNIFFAASVFESFFIMIGVYSFPGNFYQSSKNSLAYLKKQVLRDITSSRKRAYCIAFLHSCNVLKIRFGLSNYVDKTTPLTFQLFYTNRIIDVLLTQS